jgi:ketosteroid isomerase-like protein
VALGLCGPQQSLAAEPPPRESAADSIAVRNSLLAFLTAFEDLDWERFRSNFSEDACVFFPSAATPEEYRGRVAVEGRFRQEFASIRRDAPSGPPFMHLRPDSLRITLFGGIGALATFELHNTSRIGRRSVVFRKEGGAWRIAHLHASNVPWPDEPK